MLAFPAAVRIYVAAEPVDLRRGFDGLAAAVRSIVGGSVHGVGARSGASEKT